MRRVFTFSEAQTRKFCRYIQPDYAFLNFVNYYRDLKERNKAVRYIAGILSEYGCDLTLLGTGADLNDMIVTNNEEILTPAEEILI